MDTGSLKRNAGKMIYGGVVARRPVGLTLFLVALALRHRDIASSEYGRNVLFFPCFVIFLAAADTLLNALERIDVRAMERYRQSVRDAIFPTEVAA
ncbi:hypothetical protein B0J12DRAFT_151437 [Macrophomina phaseolina]|uniref:Uncharacterized protein n=1 Tax=Macrophomina phaseolina TaxID=35725 RepID=A0ABQ8G4Y8_9PEZI|nr:hypothetical protein B0J12DRAFT_151437 [Macrophomina phaseolina]